MAVTAFRLPLCLPYFSQCLTLTGHSKKVLNCPKLSSLRASAALSPSCWQLYVLVVLYSSDLLAYKDLPHTLNTSHV